MIFSYSLLLACVNTCLFAPLCTAIEPQAFASSLDNSLKLSPYTAPIKGTANTTLSTWSLTVDDTPSGYKQTMDGFGAAVTDATVTAFNSLSERKRAALLNDLFSTDGINFGLMRHTIASSDLSSVVYTYDNQTTPDKNLKKFNLLKPGRAMLALLQDMKSINPTMRLLGSVWSPPGWMKLNGVVLGTTVNNNLNASYSTSYAKYFIEYIQRFAAKGVTVDAITIQNEPLNSNAGFPTMYVSAENATTLIQDFVGPALRAAGLSTEIWAYDHNTDVPSYPQTVLDGASTYVNTVAWHCYANPLDWTVLDSFHKNNTNVTQYMTECWTSPLTPWYQSILFIMGPVQNWAAGALGWTLGSTTNYGPHLPGGCDTCRGIVEVDTQKGDYVLTNDYYYMGQFSKFVQRGSRALATTGSYNYGGGSAVEVVAFLNEDGTRTLVVFNGFGNDVWLTVTFGSGEVWSGPLYFSSVTTWLLPEEAVV